MLALTIGRADLVSKRSYAMGEVQHYEHDERGQMTAADGPGGRCTLAYAGLGRLREDLRDGLGVQHRFFGGDAAETTVLGRLVTRYLRVDATTREVIDPSGAVIRLRDHGHGIVEKT